MVVLLKRSLLSLALAIFFLTLVPSVSSNQNGDSSRAVYLSFFTNETSLIQPATCGGLTQEAEVGILSGNYAVASDGNASGGQYIHVPNGQGNEWSVGGNSNYASYCFDVSSADTYRIKARTYAPNDSDDSFFVTVDGAPATGYLWDVALGASYQDDYVSDRAGADPVTVQLSAGSHTVRVYQREDGSRLDRLILEPVPSQPEAGSIYWGAYVYNAPWNMDDLDDFETAAGRAVSILHFGYGWEENGQMKAFPTNVMQAIRNRGSIPMINWGSWELGKGPDQPEYMLSEITRGRYDGFIREWARRAKAWGHPFFLRFDHEMDGTWSFAWSVNLNDNNIEDFVPMWRHVHDIFTSEGANNVTWVWCPNTRSDRSTPYAPLYPGDDYVDWTCMDGYNFNRTSWLSFSEIFRGHAGNPYDSYAEMLSIAPSKPIMVGETSSDEAGDGGALKAAWIRDTLQTQIPNNFPAIKAVVWFNWDVNTDTTWVITSSNAATTAFRESIGLAVYTSNEFGSISTSPIPPRR